MSAKRGDRSDSSDSARGTSFTIEETIDIDAAPDVVWKVIVDFARYPEWNPFVVSCRCSGNIGDPIEMRVRIFGRFAQPQRETVFEHVLGEKFGYGLAPLPLGAMASHRTHELEPLGSDRTRYRSHFELSGWLAPLVQALLGRRLRAGFEAMTAAIGVRAQSLAPTDPDAHLPTTAGG